MQAVEPGLGSIAFDRLANRFRDDLEVALIGDGAQGIEFRDRTVLQKARNGPAAGFVVRIIRLKRPSLQAAVQQVAHQLADEAIVLFVPESAQPVRLRAAGMVVPFFVDVPPRAVGDEFSKGPVGEAQDVAIRHLEEALELSFFDDRQAGHSSLPAHFDFPVAGIRTTFSPLFFSGAAGAEDSFVAMRRAS
jgi:hypothetical protein